MNSRINKLVAEMVKMITRYNGCRKAMATRTYDQCIDLDNRKSYAERRIQRLTNILIHASFPIAKLEELLATRI